MTITIPLSHDAGRFTPGANDHILPHLLRMIRALTSERSPRPRSAAPPALRPSSPRTER
ncbi:hypothetical protein [Acrocarpospora catenulata]|uniref:hypothetical protein n=1 Tax=Acrocarpospora catenulata TaxID=2836182 RepID=UPI001BD9219C|nr:hypothetical protein [Acrocarpospora catenulata]